jgi:methyl-accepting chemotaxis protein
VTTGKTTFSRRLAGGFALTVGLTMLMGAACAGTLRAVAHSKDEVAAAAVLQLSASQQLSTTVEQRIGDYRAYLITGSFDYQTAVTTDRAHFYDILTRIRDRFPDGEKQDLLDQVVQAETAYTAALDPSMRARATIAGVPDVSQLNAAQVTPARQALQGAISTLITRVRNDGEAARRASSRAATTAMIAICALGCLAVLCAAVIAVRLGRVLRRELGAAVGHMRGSSAQLEAAAQQQAQGGRHQADAMTAISTTIAELSITARQIAGNAQRVAQIGEDTTAAARAGDTTIDRTRQSIAGIRTQMDLIVRHMLALGDRSQQANLVTDLVGELAEQTSILAVNATIEASAAGDSGRRFAVVAEEIRNLADRTTGSVKRIRTLIDEVHDAVTTTVVATKAGATAVDAGVQRFDDAATSFRRITALVAAATEAGREIELSTTQQSRVVEQVDAAAVDTARVTRDSEAGAVRTRQMAAHLSGLSADLQQLVGAAER